MEVYDFTFDFTQEPGYKNISVDYAKILWGLLLGDKCQFLDTWIAFIDNSKMEIVKRDQWQMFYQLNKQTKGNFKNFEDDGCWASIIDEFVEFYEANAKK